MGCNRMASLFLPFAGISYFLGIGIVLFQMKILDIMGLTEVSPGFYEYKENLGVTGLIFLLIGLICLPFALGRETMLIEKTAFNIYKRKLQAGIPDNTPENNAELNWKEAEEEIKQRK